MKIVLLSGGSGKRLWPLSNDVRSKQFLKIVGDGTGKTRSMLQRVFNQLQKANMDTDTILVTGIAQEELIRNQLGAEVSIVIEPERRNTFPAIVLSAAYLYFKKNCLLDETIIVLPVDLYVEDEFFCMLQNLDRVVQGKVADIVLMGIQPSGPSVKYGYIIPDYTQELLDTSCINSDENMPKTMVPVFSVVEFKEKPDECTAQKLINKGGLWNCGVFAFKLSYLMNIVSDILPFVSFENIRNQYFRLEKQSFDYAILEKEKSVAVVLFNGEWKDLGTWNTLTDIMEKKAIGDVVITDDCKNTHAINELEVPMIVMGAKNMIIVAGPDGILVSDKEQSACIKQYVENKNDQPMFVECSWGECTVLNIILEKNGCKAVTIKKKIYAGKVAEEKHQYRLKTWTILKGKAIISMGEEKRHVSVGDTFIIEPGRLYTMWTEEDTILLEVWIEDGSS